MKKSQKIIFKKQDWQRDSVSCTFPEMATENKIWCITVDDPYNSKLLDKEIQQKIKKEFSEKFSSIYFMGATSVYFYFSEPADEAMFLMYYSNESFVYDYQI